MGAIDYVKAFAKAEGIDLPDANTKRWVPRRKAQVVAAVRFGILQEKEACARYGLSLEELRSWESLATRYGVNGLRATKLQHYRGPDGMLSAAE